MKWMTILPIILKWLDRFGDWIDNISKDVKKRNNLNDINKIDSAVNDSNDELIIAELQKLIQKIEDRKKSS